MSAGFSISDFRFLCRPRAWLLAALFLCAAGVAAQDQARAGMDKPHAFMITTEKWLSNCRPYVQALDGDAQPSDEELVLCAGLVRGMLAGLHFGGKLGALGYASTAAVVFKLDQEAMFALFSELDASELLDICLPDGLRTADIISATYAHLADLPDKDRPATLAMYEALQAKYPCDEEG